MLHNFFTRSAIKRPTIFSRLHCIAICVGGLSPSLAAEPLLGFSFGVNAYNATVQGRLQSVAPEPVEQETDPFVATRFSPYALGMSDELCLEYFAEFSPDVPFVPIMRLSLIDFSYSSQFTLASDIDFVDTNITAGTQADATLDVQMVNTELTYPVVDHWLYFDVGVSINQMSIDVELIPVSEDEETEEPISPIAASDSRTSILLSSNYGIGIPHTFIYFGGHVAYYNLDDDHISELTQFLRFTFDRQGSAIATELGYRKQKYISTLDELEVNLEFGGPYLSISFSF